MSAKHLLSFKKTVMQVATLFQGVSLKLLKLKRYKIQISSNGIGEYTYFYKPDHLGDEASNHYDKILAVTDDVLTKEFLQPI